jgi:hypothetical protein
MKLSGQHDELPAEAVGFHVGVRLDDLVEAVDTAYPKFPLSTGR